MGGLMAAREAIFIHEGSSKSSCVVKTVVETNNIHKPEELSGREVVAFSYFYDLAIDAGLISGLEGSVTISDYRKAAIKACSDSESSSFACLDLTFLYGLLNGGYGLPESKTVKLYKKINGHEASWALGVGYHMIN